MVLRRSILQTAGAGAAAAPDSVAIYKLLDLEDYMDELCSAGCVARCGNSRSSVLSCVHAIDIYRSRTMTRLCTTNAPTPSPCRYVGALCGVCGNGYGRTRLLECQKCPKNRNANTGYYCLIVFVNLVSLMLTIRATILQTHGNMRPPLYRCE